MHLLMRSISPYTGEDLLLGVFRTRVEAEAARRTYVVNVLHSSSDPWAKQAYHTVKDDDVAILSDLVHDNVNASAEQVYVVTSLREGFGQTVVKFEAVVGTERAARARASSLKTKMEGYSFPFYCNIYRVMVGELRESWLEARLPGYDFS